MWGEGRRVGLSQGTLRRGKTEDSGSFCVCSPPRKQVRAVCRHCSSYTPHAHTQFYRASEIKPLGGSCATVRTQERLRGSLHLNLLQGGSEVGGLLRLEAGGEHFYSLWCVGFTHLFYYERQLLAIAALCWPGGRRGRGESGGLKQRWTIFKKRIFAGGVG